MFKRRGIAAFTLAEILITIGIVGVVCAVTIPVILANYQHMQRAAQLKKIYSEFAIATRQVVADNGGSLMRVFVLNVYNPTAAYAPYFRINKTCAMGAANGPDKCFHSAFKYLNGTAYPFMGALAPLSTGYILENGMLVLFYGNGAASATCTVDGKADVCNIVTVDINGWKQPNTVGIDIFAFMLTPKGFEPASKKYFPTDNCIYKPDIGWNTGTNTGYVCAADLLLQ